jgi:hypothetical protein
MIRQRSVCRSPAGERLAQARVTHDAVIEELLGSKLTDKQVASLAQTLGRLVEP